MRIGNNVGISMKGAEYADQFDAFMQDSWKGKAKRLVGNAIRMFLPFFYF